MNTILTHAIHIGEKYYHLIEKEAWLYIENKIRLRVVFLSDIYSLDDKLL